MNKNLHDIFTVARHELLDSIRSKRFIILMILYFAGSMLACNGLLTVLQNIETQVMETLKLSPADSTGAVADTLMKSPQFHNLISGMVKNSEVADELLSIPPLALIYTALVFSAMPLLILFSAPFRIADEVACGSARFALIRSTRAAWCTGKFVGQAIEIILPLLLTVIGFWTFAFFKAPNMAEVTVLVPMLIYAAKVWVYCLATLGLALGVSQVFNSGNKALIATLILSIATTTLHAIFRHCAGPEGWRSVLQVSLLVFPAEHRLDLWRPDLGRNLSAILHLLTAAVVSFSAGHLIFRRKSV